MLVIEYEWNMPLKYTVNHLDCHRLMSDVYMGDHNSEKGQKDEIF